VFDIGAHAGFYTLLFSHLVGLSGKVLAFEPLPRNLAYLHKHLRLNGIRNVQVLEVAVSDKVGISPFAEGENSYTGALAQTGAMRVQSVSLDDLYARGSLPLPNFIKIDVEGAEDLVLTGASLLIARARPTIFLATSGCEVDARCVQILAAMQYRLESIPGDPREWRELIAWPAPISLEHNPEKPA